MIVANVIVRHARIWIFRGAGKAEGVRQSLVPSECVRNSVGKLDPDQLACELAVFQGQLERGCVDADFGDGVQHVFQLLRIGRLDGELRFTRIGHHLECGASFRSDDRSAIENRCDFTDGVGGTRAVAPDAVHHGV